MDHSAFVSMPDSLGNCALCPRECHANRLKSGNGYCNTGSGFNISSICIHRGEEPVISGTKGICNIFFTNCNLQCQFCQNWQISRNKRERVATEMNPEELLRQICDILDRGINMVGFVSPSHVVPQVKSIIAMLDAAGYTPVIVYNSNGYDKAETLRSLEGLIDVYLPDFKYMDSRIARKYSGAYDYPEFASSALKEMYRQKGSALHLAEDGTAESGIIIRHLVLPGHVENSKKVLQFIADEVSPRLHLSLMSQYYPTPGVCNDPALNRPLRQAEYDEVVAELSRLGMQNGWIQDLESGKNYLPDFEYDHPFEN